MDNLSSVVRKRGSSGYTQVPNLLINDKNLSLRAKGAWVLIESKPDTWVFRESNLISTSTEGRDAFRSAIKELIDAGWLRRFQERNSQGLFFSVYEIHYTPLTEKPSTVEPSTDNQAPYKEGRSKKDKNPLTPEGFGLFWSAYPNKVAKPQALKAWNKHNCEIITAAILESLERWKVSLKWKKDNGEFIPHPATFLNRNSWNDSPQPENKASNDPFAPGYNYLGNSGW